MRIIFLYLFLLFFFSCSEDSKEETAFGGLAGSVSDSKTGEFVPIVNILLSQEEHPGVMENSFVTGSDGNYNIANLVSGRYLLDISKVGYKPAHYVFEVQQGKITPGHMLIERVPAKVTVDRDSLDFGSMKNTLSFQIVNSAYGELEWQIEQNCSWVKEIKPSMGSLEYGKTETIVVSIDREKLTEGENINTLIIRTSDGGTEVIMVAMLDGPLPLLKTLEATDVDLDAGTAILNGTIIKNGDPAYSERGFVYGATINPTLEDNKVVVSGSGFVGDFSAKVARLTGKDIYYFRAYATNKIGTAYGRNIEIFMQYTTIKAAELAVQRRDLGCVNWKSAASMCKNSTMGGYTDWRLPTTDELMTLYTNRESIGGFRTGVYWTSSVQTISFMNGYINENANSNNSYNVRCVRSLK